MAGAQVYGGYSKKGLEMSQEKICGCEGQLGTDPGQQMAEKGGDDQQWKQNRGH